MKTSALLLDESGKRTEDWCAYFSITADPDNPGDAAKASVVHSLLVQGHLEDFHQTPLADFVQVIQLPFEIDAVECLYLNSDSIYDEGMIEALAQFTRTPNEVPVAFVPILPSDLTGAGLILDRKILNAFKWGHPIWRRGALSCTPGTGERGWSGTSKLLRKALRSWTITTELVVRESLYRAKFEGRTLEDRNRNVSEKTKEIVQYFLGKNPYGEDISYTDHAKRVNKIGLITFERNSLRREARRDRYHKSRSKKNQNNTGQTSKFKNRFGSMIKNDVENFSALNPECDFDAHAIAEWNLKILLWLRLEYSCSMALDEERSDSSKKLIRATLTSDRQAIARRFSDRAYLGIKGRRESNGLTKDTWVSHVDMMGASETALIAFCADMDPRIVRAQLHPREPADQDALFVTARWLGTLYQYRLNYFTPSQAQKYLYLTERSLCRTDDEDEIEEVRQLGAAFKMITSFITPRGISCLEEAARSIASERIARQVYAVDPDYTGARGFREAMLTPTGVTECYDVHLGLAAREIPSPVFVPAGRLLIPGDYMDAWNRRSRGLMDVLRE